MSLELGKTYWFRSSPGIFSGELMAVDDGVALVKTEPHCTHHVPVDWLGETMEDADKRAMKRRPRKV